MKISTTQFFKTSTEQMQSRQRTVSDIQAQLGSGKQVVNPSDAPRKANLISQLESAKELQSTYLRNVETARTRLTSEETVMTAMTEIAQRVSELAANSKNSEIISLLPSHCMANHFVRTSRYLGIPTPGIVMQVVGVPWIDVVFFGKWETT